MKKHILFALLTLTLVVILAFYFKNGSEDSSSGFRQDRIDGFSLVAPRDVFLLDSLKKVKATGAEWVALVPYAFCDAATGEITFDHPSQWWGEKSEGIKESIMMAKSIGLKVMLKPHLWVGGQGWAGDLTFSKDSLWNNFESDYTAYLMNYAQIAETMQIEIFCIGTEIRKSTELRAHFWQKLIPSIRSVYSGKLTYAANWDEYENVGFWKELDFIGIDAYFPLSDAKNPSTLDLEMGWQIPLKQMREVSKRVNKPILFTEYGYESIDYPAMGHWNVSKDSLEINFSAQKTAFEAMYNVLQNESWWSGGFIWKWHLTQNGLQQRTIKAYTPQNKPAMEAISKAFNSGNK